MGLADCKVCGKCACEDCGGNLSRCRDHKGVAVLFVADGQSPWRSLRYDPPTFQDWKPVLLRDTECRHVRDAARDAIVTRAVSYYLIRSDRAEEKLRDGFTEWMEIPK